MKKCTRGLKHTLAVLATITTFSLCCTEVTQAQVLINENFSSATGLTPPAGWTNVDNGPTTPNQIWDFNNPGGRTFTGGSPGFSAPFAILDSDNYGSGEDQNSDLVTPPFDASAAGYYFLEFDNNWEQCCGAIGTVEVWNGSTWTAVPTVAGDGGGDGDEDPSTHEFIDITAAAGSSTTAQVRFHYEGSWDYWWAIDNVKISRLDCNPPAATFSTVPNCGSGQFSISVNVTGMGTATSLNIKEGATVLSTVSATGTYTVGPFTSGTSHVIAVANASDTVCTIVSSPQAYYCPPVNDACGGAINLTVASSTADCSWVTASTYGAGQTSPNPASCWSSSNDDDIWYTFTATATDLVFAYTNFNPSNPSNTDPVGMELFTGTCGATTQVPGTCGSFGAGGPGGSGEVLLSGLTVGTQYYLYLLTSGTAIRATFDICVHIPPSPPSACVTNTSPANNATVPLNPGTLFTWTADPSATAYDFYIGTSVAGATNLATSNTNSFTVYGFDPNTTYYWYVVPVNIAGSATGCDANATSFTSEAGLSNDECTGAIDISNQSFSYGTNNTATQSLPGGSCAGGATANDAWYKIVAGAAGSITVEQEVPNFDDLVLEVLSGTCAGGLTQIACDADSWDVGVNSITFTATAGTTYYVRTYGTNGTDVGSFAVRATGTPLPVDMSKLEGKLSNGNLPQLFWQTFSEQKNAGFEIQRSNDGKNFSRSGFVRSQAANGDSKETIGYQYTDNRPVSGTVYYRLMQVDLDGKSVYSNIISLTGKDDGSFTMVASPNPTKHSLTVNTYGKQGSNSLIYVTDIAGKVIKTVSVKGTETNIDMSGLMQGIYLIKYTDTERTQTIKVSKQ